jgi:hypothetical protein
MMQCAYCDYANPDSENFCIRCGLPLKQDKLSSDETRRLEGLAARVDFSRWGPAHLGADRKLVLHIPGEDQPITLPPATEQLVLGRYDAATSTAPDVDLSRYDALEKGVSRRHAAIMTDEDLYKIVDLNSANATYVNGQKLIAHQARILQDGDEVQLGKLILRVQFAE